MKEQKNSRKVEGQVEQTVRHYSSWITALGRLGYAAKGVIFIIVGFLAAYSAIGARAADDGTNSAMRHIDELPLGQFMLVAVAVGLIFHALWRFVQAFMDTENKGSETKGFVARGVYAAIALIYIGLAFSAVKIVLGVKVGGIWMQNWTAWLLALPFGDWLVGLAGIVMFVVGFYQFYQTFSAKFRENLLIGNMSATEENWATRVGRFGFAARGVVFCIIGFFLVLAAYQANAGKIRDLGGALHAVEQQPFGAWLLGLTAAGFVSYGLFMFVLAKYRRMIIT